MLAPFQEPTRLFDAEARSLDDFAERLSAVLPRQLERDRSTLEFTRKSLSRSLPRLLARDAQRVASLSGQVRLSGVACDAALYATCRLRLLVFTTFPR